MSRRHLSRRTLLVGGGAGVGLAIAWALWPRSYAPSLREGDGQSLFNAFLKIGRDGRVIVAVPQAELGQGVYTSLPQILADELGADWRTVSVEPAPISPLYANALLAAELERLVPAALKSAGRWAVQEYATRNALMLTGGSTSVRTFETRLREAGAAARALLSLAAARRWDVDWEQLDTAGGFVTHGTRRLAFGELAEEAAGLDVPERLPVRAGVGNRLVGQSLPRLDAPAKVDGSALFAGDVRLPGMVFASVRAGPIGESRLVRADADAATRIPGVLAAFQEEGWAGAAATNWWLADRAVRAMNPVFATGGALVDTASVEEALARAMRDGEATRFYEAGDVEDSFVDGATMDALYTVSAAPSAAPETLTATVRLNDGRLEVWAPTQAPSLARAAAACAADLSEAKVTLYPTLVGGGYGRKLETAAIEQAVVIAARMKRPVQLVWSRTQECIQDGFQPPAHARLSAKFGAGRRLIGWRAQIAAPATARDVAARIRDGESGKTASASAVNGATPSYTIPAVAIDHVPVQTGLRTGLSRSGAHGYTCFFTESFVDELARKANLDPFSFRMGMLGDEPRLARVLSSVATLGGWDGGGPGSIQGLAVHGAFGSYVALLVEAGLENGRIRVTRAVCAVDCGRVVNPEIVRQLVEGGIIHGIALATGTRIGFDAGLPSARTLGSYGLPRLRGTPEISVEIVDSGEPPGGVTELAVPPVAPAVANALYASTGQRLRSLPLSPGAA